MAVQRTFSIIKPDATKRNITGKVNAKIEEAVMGATNPSEAAAGTIRAEFAESIDANTVHGSDAPETAAEEIPFFFSEDEIVG